MKTKLIALMSALMLSNAYSAQYITYDLNTVSVGSVAPLGDGIAPWATIDIIEVGTTSVLFNVQSNMSNGEFFSSLGLNLVDSFAYGPVTFTAYPTLGDFTLPTITVGNNANSGGAGVGYDVWFEFATTNSGGGVKRFNEADTFTYRIDGIGINDFRVESNAIVAHAQNLTGGVSSWVSTGAVPEPSAVMLGWVGMFFLLTNRRRA